MLFKDLKRGSIAYLINNSKDGWQAISVKVINVGAPYFDTQSPSPVFDPKAGASLQKVVDFTIDRGTGNETYKIPENLSTTCSGSTILFADRESFLMELDSLKAQSEEVISSIDYHRDRHEHIEQAIAEFNPQFKEKREQDERLSKIEQSIGRIESVLSALSAPPAASVSTGITPRSM